MSKDTYDRCVELYRAGYYPREIVRLSGFSQRDVMTAIHRARKRGDITAHQSQGNVKLSTYVQMSSVSLGAIGDIRDELSNEQFKWLVDEAERIGCSTVAEYLAEIVRDLYAEAMLARQ